MWVVNVLVAVIFVESLMMKSQEIQWWLLLGGDATLIEIVGFFVFFFFCKKSDLASGASCPVLSTSVERFSPIVWKPAPVFNSVLNENRPVRTRYANCQENRIEGS